MNFRVIRQLRVFRLAKQVTTLYLGIVLSFLLILSGYAQGQHNDEKAENIQVMDKSISHDELMVIMNKFTNSLGVGCDHCHAASKTDPNAMDFASDDNKVKLTARAMMEMVGKINGTFIANLPSGDTPHVAVQCVTCHHGQPKPILLQDMLVQVRKERGMKALDSVYRELRSEYYGGFTYDFGERTLGLVAQAVSEESNQDALKVLELNREFNPKSAYNEWATGRIYFQMGDTASAIAGYKRALEIMPEFRRAKRDLDMLTSGKKP